MVHPHNTRSTVRFVFNFAGWKGLIGKWKFYWLFFKKKIYLGQFDLFRPFLKVWLGIVEIESGHCYYWILSQDLFFFFMITAGSLNSQGMIRIHKQSRHDFSGKNLCDGYCMDIMWYLCVEVKIQHRVIWFCKASLRICYTSLFECKRPWMLKTDSLIF